MTSMSTNQRFALLVPPVLIVTMYGAFRYLTAGFGFPAGYLAAFALYWVGWCLIVPAVLLRRDRVLSLFARSRVRLTKLSGITQLLLWWPIAFPFTFSFVPRIASTPFVIVAMSMLLGVVIGVTEEILWRGVYVTLFPDRCWLNTVYPSIAFGLWHLCPLAVLPSRYPGGALSFVAYSTALGFSYAYSARSTGSIRLCTVSHCVHDALGLGAFAYSQWLT